MSPPDLLTLRVNAVLTQQEAARELAALAGSGTPGSWQAAISRYETGAAVPTLRVLALLLEIYGLEERAVRREIAALLREEAGRLTDEARAVRRGQPIPDIPTPHQLGRVKL